MLTTNQQTSNAIKEDEIDFEWRTKLSQFETFEKLLKLIQVNGSIHLDPSERAWPNEFASEFEMKNRNHIKESHYASLEVALF